MRLEQLQYLLDIVQTHSITSTAQRFFVTQQAVSSSFKQLENEMGAVLLDRRPNGVTLTAQGKLAARFAQRVLDDWEQTRAEIEALEDTCSEQTERCIRVCSASVMNNVIMPKVLNVLDKRDDGLSVNIIETTADALFDLLLQGKCDLGLLSINTSYLLELLAQEAHQKLHCKVLMKDKLLACMSVKSHYAQLDKITEEQIHTTAKMVYGLTPIDRHKKSAFEESIICSNDLEFHRKILAQNDVFAIMPQVAYTQLFRGKKFVAKPIELDERVEITHGLIYQQDAGEAIHEFISLLDECMRQL